MINLSALRRHAQLISPSWEVKADDTTNAVASVAEPCDGLWADVDGLADSQRGECGGGCGPAGNPHEANRAISVGIVVGVEEGT